MTSSLTAGLCHMRDEITMIALCQLITYLWCQGKQVVCHSAVVFNIANIMALTVAVGSTGCVDTLFVYTHATASN